MAKLSNMIFRRHFSMKYFPRFHLHSTTCNPDSNSRPFTIRAKYYARFYIIIFDKYWFESSPSVPYLKIDTFSEIPSLFGLAEFTKNLTLIWVWHLQMFSAMLTDISEFLSKRFVWMSDRKFDFFLNRKFENVRLSWNLAWVAGFVFKRRDKKTAPPL